MRHVLGRLLLAIAIGLSAVSASAEAPQAQQKQAASGKQKFIKPVSLRGTLGDAQIQANLRTKPDFEDGIEGDYFVFGQSQKILLAGEVEADEVFLEESENGTDVSGQWNGKLVGDTITGEWQSANGQVIKQFNIKIVPIVRTVPTGDNAKRAPTAKAATGKP